MAKQYGSNSPYPGDEINGKLEQGEYEMNRNVLAIPGMKKYLDKLNYEVAPRYARGGEVNGYALGGLASWSKSLFDKFKKPATSNESDMPSLGSEEADFFAQQYGSAPTPSEELEADSGTYDPHGIFKASEDYNPLAPEAPQKTGLKESLRGFGEKAGHFLEQNVQFPAIQAGIDAKEGLGNLHKYLGAGKAENYQDVLTGKEKGNLYQRAGKGLGMLSSLMSEFAAPGMGRGNLKGYGKYKGSETPALKDVAPSEEVKKADELEVKPEEQKLDLDKDISQEIIDRDKVVLEESVADDGVGLDYNEVGADTTAEERLRTELHGGDVGFNTGELTDESLSTGMSASSTATNQNLNLSGGINPDPRSPWYGSDIDYSLNPEEVEEKAGGGLIGRAMGYQTGGEAKAHDSVDNMINVDEMTTALAQGMANMKNTPEQALQVPLEYGGTKYHTVKQYERPEGKRYYHGSGEGWNPSMAKKIAELSAINKMRSTPADSIPSNQIQSLLDSLRQQGGYQEGGMVSGNNSRRMFDFMKKRRY